MKIHDVPSVDDHPFEPRDAWWSLCEICGLARAAHLSSTSAATVAMQEHFRKMKERDTHLDISGKAQYTNGNDARQAEVERLHQGGRPRIGYVGDEILDE